jgi:hypothetical protein
MSIIPQIKAPEGWTTDPEELGYDWWTSDGADSPSQILAERFGLAAPSWPIIAGTPHMGCDSIIFGSGDKFYVFNLIGTTVWEITSSQNLNTIIEIMAEKGMQFLDMKQINKLPIRG